MPNSNFNEIATTTLENRSGIIADSATGNNAVLAWIKANGGVKTFTGGTKILQELYFADNVNAGWYSGADELPTAQSDVITAAEYAIKQASVQVVFTGLDDIENDGKAAVADLYDARIGNAEGSMANLISTGIFSTGTGSGGRQLTGLGLAVPVTPTTGTYGNIDRSLAANVFWRSIASDPAGAETTATIQPSMNAVYNQLVRGADKPDLCVMDATSFGIYEGSLQLLQRFTSDTKAKLGFETLRYKSCDVVLDGNCTANTVFILNTKFLHFRPSSKRNFVPLKARMATNQDLEVAILAFAGNLTCSGAKFQGRLTTA